MSKEKQIQEYENKRLIDELSKMPPMVVATAYLHAINYTLYGEDVTEKWLSAVANASALEKAYRKGYYDAMEKVNRERELQASEFLAEARGCAENEALTAIDDIKQEIFNAIDNVPITLSRNDADNLLKMDIQDIIDKYKVDKEE